MTAGFAARILEIASGRCRSTASEATRAAPSARASVAALPALRPAMTEIDVVPP